MKPYSSTAFFFLLLLACGCRETGPSLPEHSPSVTVSPSSVQTTIDPELQAFAGDLFEGKEGYLVALDPASGEILAMLGTSGGAWTPAVLTGFSGGETLPAGSPLRLVSWCATLANRGFCHTPHLYRGDEVRRMDPVVEQPVISRTVEQMWWDVNNPPGTGARAWIAHVDGLDVCGSVAEAGDGGLTDSVFFGFAPRDSPRIAVAVRIAGGGPGARYAAPIGSLVIERHLTGRVGRTDLARRMKEARPLGKKSPETASCIHEGRNCKTHTK